VRRGVSAISWRCGPCRWTTVASSCMALCLWSASVRYSSTRRNSGRGQLSPNLGVCVPVTAGCHQEPGHAESGRSGG
jgi:hypothetical protein